MKQLRMRQRAGLVVDLFAGGGGASMALAAALGREPDLAINHSPTALAVHAANHPATRHLATDIWDVDPIEATKGQPRAARNMADSLTVLDYARTVLASRKVEGLRDFEGDEGRLASTVLMTEKYAKILDEDLLMRVGARNDNVPPPPDTERDLSAYVGAESDQAAE